MGVSQYGDTFLRIDKDPELKIAKVVLGVDGAVWRQRWVSDCQLRQCGLVVF